MAKRKAVKFKVTGKGEFPYDMLRYDSCWPFQPADANAMSFDYQVDLLAKREVNLISASSTAPTEGRWMSFLWTVSNIEPYY